jgi:hypothetical protein
MAEDSLLAVPGLMGHIGSTTIDIRVGSGKYSLTFFMVS